MLKQRARVLALAAYALDLALVAVAFVLAYWVRSAALPAVSSSFTPLYPLERYLPLLPLALVAWAVALPLAGRYRSVRLLSPAQESGRALRAAVLATALLVVAIYALRLDEALLAGDQFSRLWLLLMAAISFLLLTAATLVSRSVARRRAAGYHRRAIVLVGSGAHADRIAATLGRHRQWGFELLGRVATDAVDAEGGAPYLGRLEELAEIVDRQVVDEVIFAVDRRQLDRLEDTFLTLEEVGIRTRLALDLFPNAGAHVELGELDGTPLLTFSTGPDSPLQLALKRAFDLVVAGVLLVVLSPLILLIALAIRASSRGPVLFRQTRCGVNGRRFTLYKFRTMVADAEARRDEVAHLNVMDGPVFKARRDPRVTPLGRWLRRFSLDELPQLWNVLAGQMSLVGPRPPIPAEVEQYERWQRRRLSMKPGLTCLWQISGRNEVDFDRWMELDLEYIDTWTPWLDLEILLKTVPVVLSGRGAS